MPYSLPGLNMNEITGGTPYGASTLAGGDGSRQPSANELAIARFQGKACGGDYREACGRLTPLYIKFHCH